MHFISICYVDIFWTANIRYAFNPVSCYMHEIQFLILNTNDYYNKNMNIFDISNQLYNQYTIGHLFWKCKWWWVLFWWGHGVNIVNSYVIFKTECELKSIRPMIHYELWRQLVLSKLHPQTFRGWDHLVST